MRNEIKVLLFLKFPRSFIASLSAGSRELAFHGWNYGRNRAICFNAIRVWTRVACRTERSPRSSAINRLHVYTKTKKSKNTSSVRVWRTGVRHSRSVDLGGPWRPAHLAGRSFRNLISILISKNRFVLSNCYAMVITHRLWRIQPLSLARLKVCERLLLLEIQISPSDSNLTTFLVCVYKKHNL